MNELTIVGLAYDIVGVIVLVLAIIGPKAPDLYQQASNRIGANKSLFEALMLQRTDAWFGLSALVIGFALQGIGALPLDVPSYALWLLAPILPGFIVYLVVRHRSALSAERLFWEMMTKQDASDFDRSFGAEAKARASRMADGLLEEGEPESAARWRRVVKAIDELQDAEGRGPVS